MPNRILLEQLDGQRWGAGRLLYDADADGNLGTVATMKVCADLDAALAEASRIARRQPDTEGWSV